MERKLIAFFLLCICLFLILIACGEGETTTDGQSGLLTPSGSQGLAYELGTGVKEIAVNALEGFTSLSYRGTVEEWGAISLDPLWDGNPETTPTVHCADGDIS